MENLSEDTIRRNLHMAPAGSRPTRAYRILHRINALLRVVIVLLILLVAFKIQRVDVEGNESISDEQITEWINSDRMSGNSLYAIWKYDIRHKTLNPAIAKTRVSFRLPWRVKVKVTEVPTAGMVETEGGHYVFNRNGVLISTQAVDKYGLLVTGVTPAKTKLFEKMAFEEGDMADQLIMLTEELDQNDLEPDEAEWQGDVDGWQLHFGSTYANLGTALTSDKIHQLALLYPEVRDREGILHLEAYESGDDIVRFEQGLPAVEEDEEEF